MFLLKFILCNDGFVKFGSKAGMKTSDNLALKGWRKIRLYLCMVQLNYNTS